jgi:putative copper export protein
MPGARFARFLMIVVAVLVVAGLVASLVAAPQVY